MQDFINSLDWQKCPLIPTIAQDVRTKCVLMLAYSSPESLKLTFEKKLAHYFSRSKNRIWQKGEESGHIQKIIDVRYDCDSDTLLFLVEQNGVACHTGEYSCFYRSALDSEIREFGVQKLYETIISKKGADSEKSYTAKLFGKGENEICKKIIEEAGELAIALKDNQNFQNLSHANKPDSENLDSESLDSENSQNQQKKTPRENVIYECADLVYHALVGLAHQNISPSEIINELARREGISGIDEKNSRPKNKQSQTRIS